MKVILVALFTIVFALESSADICYSKDGKEVIFTPQPSEIIDALGFAGATACRLKDDRRVVLLDLEALNKMPSDFKRFVLSHECGHHALGHIMAGKKYDEGKIPEKEEQEADCYAKARMDRLGVDMRIIHATLNDRKKMKILKADYKRSVKRSRLLRNCK